MKKVKNNHYDDKLQSYEDADSIPNDLDLNQL